MTALVYGTLSVWCILFALLAYKWRIRATPGRRNAQWALVVALLMVATVLAARAVAVA